MLCCLLRWYYYAIRPKPPMFARNCTAGVMVDFFTRFLAGAGPMVQHTWLLRCCFLTGVGSVRSASPTTLIGTAASSAGNGTAAGSDSTTPAAVPPVLVVPVTTALNQTSTGQSEAW
jgi:hypothetical protein